MKIAKILLFIVGVALLGFFVWLGVGIAEYLGVM